MPTNPANDRRLIEVYVEPDAGPAEEQFREMSGNAQSRGAVEPIPDLGQDAFYSPSYQSVTVLHDGKLLELSYEAQLDDYRDDTSPAIVQTTIELAARALERLR